MLIFILKSCWYDKIASGEKEIEYREVKPYWRQRVKSILPPCFYSNIKKINATIKREKLEATYEEYVRPLCQLRKAYTSERMIAKIKKIVIVNGLATDLKIDKPVYAFHLEILFGF